MHKVLHYKGDFRFNCNLCYENFNTAKNLIKHRQIEHEGLRFSCQFCPSMFKRQNLLEKHIQIHYPFFESNRVSCPKCSKRLYEKDLENHLVVYHNYDTKFV